MQVLVYTAALGDIVLTHGTHVLTFRYDAVRGNAGNIVLGVADADAPPPHVAPSVGAVSTGGAPSAPFAPTTTGGVVAWGYHAFYGRVMESRRLGEVGAPVERQVRS